MSEPLQVLRDTHAFLSWVTDEKPLPRKAARMASDEGNSIFVSHANIWAIAINAALGKLTLPEAAGSFVQKPCKLNRFQLLPISLDAVAMIETLPDHHNNACDRLLVA